MFTEIVLNFFDFYNAFIQNKIMNVTLFINVNFGSMSKQPSLNYT